MFISFETRSGLKIKGVVCEDYGHALLIRVEHASRKNARNRTQLYPKNDMLNCTRWEDRQAYEAA
jgi:hypothetical protein